MHSYHSPAQYSTLAWSFYQHFSSDYSISKKALQNVLGLIPEVRLWKFACGLVIPSTVSFYRLDPYIHRLVDLEVMTLDFREVRVFTECKVATTEYRETLATKEMGPRRKAE